MWGVYLIFLVSRLEFAQLAVALAVEKLLCGVVLEKPSEGHSCAECGPYVGCGVRGDSLYKRISWRGAAALQTGLHSSGTHSLCVLCVFLCGSFKIDSIPQARCAPSAHSAPFLAVAPQGRYAVGKQRKKYFIFEMQT